MGGQDCDGPWLAGPYWVTAHPVSWLPDVAPVGDDRQINSEDRRSVRLRGQATTHRHPPVSLNDPDRHRDDAHSPLVEGSALLPRDIEAPDRSQQAHVTASHSTNARVRSRR